MKILITGGFGFIGGNLISNFYKNHEIIVSSRREKIPNSFNKFNGLKLIGHNDLLSKNKGKIVCISSICGLEVIPGAPVTYSVSKSALNSYVKSMSFPLSRRGISINAIAPGNILFDGSTWDQKTKSNPTAVRDYITTNVPLNKFGTTSDISSLCSYLLSPLGNFITGSVFTIDGGQTRSFK